MSKASAVVWLGGGSFAAYWFKLIIQKHFVAESIEPCLSYVLYTFCVIINFNNPIVA